MKLVSSFNCFFVQTSRRNNLEEEARRHSEACKGQNPQSAGGVGGGADGGDRELDEDVYDEDELLEQYRGLLPTSFGERGRDTRVATDAPQSIGAMEQSGATAAMANEEFNTDDDNNMGLPISCEATLEAHRKAVVALALDHSGSRLLTGSDDYTVKLFDFNGMKSDCRSFRQIEPCEGHPVVALSWSPNSDSFLVVTGSPQPKIYDRDGKEQGEFPRGDMYIRDMKNTKGHVTGCTSGAWHPIDKGTGLTSSSDGTLRVWDLWTFQQKTVIKPTLLKPGRIAVTTCGWSPDGKLIAGGLIDGTIQLWDVRGKFGHSAAVGAVLPPKAQGTTQQNWTYVSKSGQIARKCHDPQSDITCVRFSSAGNLLLSRSTDETLKLWDVRKFTRALAEVKGLHTLFSTTQCCFSPNEELVLTGISPERKDGLGCLGVFKANDLSLVRHIGVRGSCIAVLWHPKINQIITGSGDRSEGVVRVLYDPRSSNRGALLSVGRRPRAETTADFVADLAPRIYNPNALPLYREAMPPGMPGSKRKNAMVDASIRTSKSFKPDVGQAGVSKGAGGKLGATGGTLLTQYILKHQGTLKAPADEDVRASILRHADKEDEYSLFTAAYKSTQPQKVFADVEEMEEEKEEGSAPS